jgi:hypothetical protein
LIFKNSKSIGRNHTKESLHQNRFRSQTRISKLEEKLAPQKCLTMLVADAGDLDDMNNPTPQLRARIKRVCMNRTWNLTNCEFLIINTGLYRYTKMPKDQWKL